MEDIERIHVAMGRAWAGLEQERVGDWTLRFGRGYTSRANSALPVGDPEIPLEKAIERVEQAYRARNLTPCFQVPLLTAASSVGRLDDDAERAGAPMPGTTIDTGARPAWPALDHLLAERGYAWEKPSIVQILGPTGNPEPPAPAGIKARWGDEPDDGWLSLASQRFLTHPAAKAVTMAHPARYVTLWSAGEPVGRGRVSVAGDWFDISDVLVVPALRGRGVGRWAMEVMACCGRALGAANGVLQVEADNVRAHTLYRSLGWQDAGGYHYRTLAG